MVHASSPVTLKYGQRDIHKLYHSVFEEWHGGGGDDKSGKASQGHDA